MREKTNYKLLFKNNISSLFSFLNLGFIQGSNALIQLFLIYIVTRIVGLTELGSISVATSYAMLVSLFINFGSNQSGVKDVALHQRNEEKLSEIFYTIYTTRVFFFLISLAVILALHYSIHLHYGLYFLLANTIVLSETLNPFFFFVGIQKLFLYNVVNLAGRLLSAAAVIYFTRSDADGVWVNFYMGLGSALAYGFLLGYLIKKNKLAFRFISMAGLKKYIGKNVYLTGNNLSVQLQQSFFLFAVATVDPLILGAYSLCDKIVWSFRLFIISFSNAIYPRAVVSYQHKRERWVFYKRKINMALFAIFTLTGLGILLFAPWITLLITGGENALATFYIKCVSFVPLVAALNSLNVIDLLMKDRYHYIFIIALLLLGVTIASACLFITKADPLMFGYYPITVEIFSLPLYWYFIRRAGSGEGRIA